ncbi:MAG: PD-(D/E)XK nuclease family protein [Pseudomonadota bacterium]
MTFFPPGLMFILPSSLAAAQERRRLLNLAPGGAILGPRLYTFGRLEAESAGEASGSLGKISDPARDLVLEKLLDAEKEALGWPAGSSAEGLGKRLVGLINQLRLSRVSPGEFSQLAEGLIPPERLEALTRVFQGYEDFLADRNMTDGPGLRLGLINRLKSGAIPKTLRHINRIELLGFHRLTPFQAELCLALSEAGLKVAVELTCPEWVFDFQRDSEEWRDSPFLETLASAGTLEAAGSTRTNLELAFTDPRLRGPASKKVTRRLNDLFRPNLDPAGRDEGGTGLEIVAAAGRYAEVEEIGRRVNGLIETGVAPEAIALAVRDLGRYGPLVEDVFRRFRLPLFFRRGAPLAIQVPVRALNALLNLAASHWNRELVLDLLASPYLDLGFEISRARIVELSALAGVTDERAGGGWEANLQRLAQARPADRADVEKILAGLKRLKDRVAPSAQPRTWSEFAEKAVEMLEQFGFSRLLRADLEFIHRDAPAWSMLRETLADLARAAAEAGREQELHPPEYFSKKLITALEERNVGPSLGGAGGIMVVAVHDLHGLFFDYLFLAGLNEGEFPRPGRENIIMGDAQVAELNRRAGRRVLATTAAETRQEELVFFHALASAGQGLVLSFARMDSQGRVRLPSSVLDEVTRLWPEGELAVYSPPPGVIPSLDQALTREELFGGLTSTLFQGSDPTPAREILSVLFENRPDLPPEWESLLGRIVLEKKRLSGAADLLSGKISPRFITSWLAGLPRHQGAPLLSPTFLEEFGRCPFLFWAARVIGLEPPGEAGDEVDPRDEGRLLHDILKDFLRERRDQGLPSLQGTRDEAEHLGRVEKKVLDRAEGRLPLGRRPLWEARRKNIGRILEQWLRREPSFAGAYRPSFFEWDFKPGGTAPPLEIELAAGGKIFIQGRLDRIDLAPDGARVIDYKLSSNAAQYGRLLKPDQLGVVSFQAPTYLAVAAREFKRPVEAVFLLLKDFSTSWKKTCAPEDASLLATDPGLRRELAAQGRLNFFNRVEETWTRLVSGLFFPAPETGPCEYCTFRTTCRSFSLEGAPGEGP